MEKLNELYNRVRRGVDPLKHNPVADRLLIDQFLRGNKEAGWELLESYADIVSHIYHNPTKPPYRTKQMRTLYSALNYQDREDLFQEIAAQFFQLVHEYEPSMGPFVNYVRGTLHQRVFNRYFSSVLEDQKYLDKSQEIEEILEGLATELSTSRLPNEFLKLYQLLAELPPKQREIIILSIANGLSSRAVAEESNISRSYARVLKRRALKQLKRAVKSKGGVI